MTIIAKSDIKQLLYDKLSTVCSNIGTLKIDLAFYALTIKKWTTSPTTTGSKSGLKPAITIAVVQQGILSVISTTVVSNTTLSTIIDKVFLDNGFTNDIASLTIQDYVSRIIQKFFNTCIYAIVSPFNKKSCCIFVPIASNNYNFSLTKNLIYPYNNDSKFTLSFTDIINNAILYLPSNHIILLTNTAKVL